MAEQREDPVPTEDPRQSETSDQNAEESQPGTSPGSGRPGDDGPSPDAPARRTRRRATPGRRPGIPTPPAEPARPGLARRTHTNLCVRIGPTRSGGGSVVPMRKEAALIAVLGVLGWSAAPAVAAPNLLAHWTLDEGVGQIAADASGHGSSGVLGAIDRRRRRRSDVDPGPRRRQRAGLRRRPVRRHPRHRDARARARQRRRLGAPRRLARPVSLRPLQGRRECDRSAYGLYSGLSGGMAFYVSSTTQYVISPEVSAAIVWDGNWHHVVGSYDGIARAAVDRRPPGGHGHVDEHASPTRRQQGGLRRDLPRLLQPRLPRRDR